MAHDIFISHSSKDKQTTEMICRYLERQGVRCWMAPRDIKPGGDWAEAIVDAISNSNLMLLIFSSNANTSAQINREISVAANENVNVVPFRIEDIQPSKKLQYYLSTPHWIDALPLPVEDHLEYLANSVKGLLPQGKKEGIEEAAPKKGDSEEYPRTRLAENKETPGIERFFIFNEASEPISDRAKLTWIGLTVAACFAMIVGFTAAIFAIKTAGNGDPVYVAISLNIRTGMMIILGWTMALAARTHPMYGYFSGFLASATVSFLISINILTIKAGFTAVPMITFTLLNVLVFAAVLGGIFLHKAYLWVYAGLVSSTAIIFGLFFGGSDLVLILVISFIELILAVIALFIHRRRNLRGAAGGSDSR